MLALYCASNMGHSRFMAISHDFHLFFFYMLMREMHAMFCMNMFFNDLCGMNSDEMTIPCL